MGEKLRLRDTSSVAKLKSASGELSSAVRFKSSEIATLPSSVFPEVDADIP